MQKFCIPIKVEDESVLYDRFLPSGLAFSGELMDYLTDYIEDRKPGEQVRIELHASREPDMEHFRKTYTTCIQKLIQRNKVETGKADIQAVMFMFMGVAFVAAGIVLAGKVDRIFAEILAAGGSFALWGAISAFLETLPTLRYKKKLLQIFLKAEICYKEIPNK